MKCKKYKVSGYFYSESGEHVHPLLLPASAHGCTALNMCGPVLLNIPKTFRNLTKFPLIKFLKDYFGPEVKRLLKFWFDVKTVKALKGSCNLHGA